MARIAGIDLPIDKRIEIALTYIFGIGRSTSIKILKEVDVSKDVKVKDLAESDVSMIRAAVQALVVEGDLRRAVGMDIKRLKDLGNYCGLRHRKSLPARGQRTKTNARTRKGPKKLAVGKKKK